MKKWLSDFFGGRKAQDWDEDADETERPTSPKAADTRTGAADSMVIDDMQAKPRKVKLVKNKFPKQKKKWSVRKKAIVFSCIGVVAAALIVGGVWVYTITSDPLAQFNPGNTQSQPTETLPGTETSAPANGEVTPSPTPNPEEVLLSQADQAMLAQKFVNILLIGVDHSVERDTWNGKKDFHADVMIVLSINKETNAVSMISLPRDTYAKIPGVDGIYKLNAAINCGGGWGDSGFQKVCEAAEWMLGDVVQLDGYFAVDMNAVKGLVDAIGGVDYDLDISFDMQGRNYTKGLQHMDGQAVLDYLRIRKAEHMVEKNQATDANRVKRQKKMLIEIFKKIKSNGLLTSIPDLITAFDGNLEYNLSFNQIAALAYYALMNVNPDDIQMYSMGGGTRNIFNWNFVITDQTNRLKIMQDVYGVDVPKRTDYMLSSAQLLWGQMQAPHYAEVAQPILDQVKAILDADALKEEKPVPTAPPTPTPTATPGDSTEPTESTEPTPSPSPTPSPTPAPTVTPPPGGWRQYAPTGAEWTLYNKVVTEYQAVLNYESYESGEELLALVDQFRKDVTAMCNLVKITPPTASKWRVNYEKNENEVYVDFN